MLPVILNENGTEKLLPRLGFVPSGRLLLGSRPALADIARSKLITLMTNGELLLLIFLGKLKLIYFYRVHVAKNLTLEVNICGTFRH